jgi:hypothetical protein
MKKDRFVGTHNELSHKLSAAAHRLEGDDCTFLKGLGTLLANYGIMSEMELKTKLQKIANTKTHRTNSGRSKLNKDQARTAYNLMHYKGWTTAKAADQYGVAKSTMGSLRCGASWGWVTGHYGTMREKRDDRERKSNKCTNL